MSRDLLHQITTSAPPCTFDRRIPSCCRYGVYIKKEQYQKEAFNPKTRQKVIATRTRATRRSFELRPDEAAGFLLTRFWPGPGPGPGMAPAGVGAPD